MSSAQSPEDHEIEQTKQLIRSLVGEIAQLSKSDVAPEEFYGQFLPRVVSALAAVGGAVWTTNSEGRLALQYQVDRSYVVPTSPFWLLLRKFLVR